MIIQNEQGSQHSLLVILIDNLLLLNINEHNQVTLFQAFILHPKSWWREAYELELVKMQFLVKSISL